MTTVKAVALAGLLALAFVAAPFAASARVQDSANSGVCKSGKHVSNVKNCKEHGGKN